MKNLFRASIFVTLSFLASACSQSVTATPSPIPSPTTMATATFTPVPSPTATATIEPTSRPEFVPPTLIPTIDPTLVPGLLSKAFSIQIAAGINGRNMRQITGWNYGFGHRCGGYQWLDATHLLLFPSTGQYNTENFGMFDNTSPVVINLDSKNVWLPSYEPRWNCIAAPWSSELQAMVLANGDHVSTYDADGKMINQYPGKLIDVSPSGTKVLVDDDTWIDLQSEKKVDFDWKKVSEEFVYFPQPIWSSDEMQVYTCCYRYGNARTGEGYTFPYNDLSLDGKKATGNLYHSYGEWVKNDSFLLVQWDFFYDSNPGFIPLFDPKGKTLRDLNMLANIPTDVGGPPNCQETSPAPDGNHVWAECYTGNYLINLADFTSEAYHRSSIDNFYWSSDNKFAWLSSSELGNTQFQILSVSDKVIKPFPVNPVYESLKWHPTNGLLAYINEGKDLLIILDAQTMTAHKLVLPTTFNDLVWSPSGNHVALAATDGSLWQLNYPKLDYLEQLTPSLPNVREVNWSPDGSSIAFISGSDIYVVETNK